jgi:hypothetical protein
MPSSFVAMLQWKVNGTGDVELLLRIVVDVRKSSGGGDQNANLIARQ